MSFISDCEALRDSRFNQFGHFHDCQSSQLLAQPLPEFFLELATGGVTSPTPPFRGFEADEANYSYDTSELTWTSENNADPPDSADGVLTRVWNIDSQEVTDTGQPFNPVAGQWNDQDILEEKETQKITEFWNPALGVPPERIVTNTKDTVRLNRVLPGDLMDWCKARNVDYAYPEFGNRIPFLPVFNPVAIENDSAGGMTEQFATNMVAGLTRAKVRFGIKGLKNGAAAATVTFKARVWTIRDDFSMESAIATISASIIGAHPTERDTWVTDWCSIDLPGEVYGGEFDELTSPPYSGLGLPWMETVSGFKPNLPA
jgi:hypothetical protein